MLDDGGARHLKPGMALPSVTLPSTHGTEIDVAALPGRSLLIVYPWTGRAGQPTRRAGTTFPARTARRRSWRAYATAMQSLLGLD